MKGATLQCWCYMQIVRGDLLNAKNQVVRAAAHLTWTVLIELPSYVISADGMRAWDQAVVAAAIAQSHAMMGLNATGGADVELSIHSACAGEHQYPATAALLSSSMRTS